MNKRREIFWVGLAGLCITLPVALYYSFEMGRPSSLFVTVPLAIGVSFGLFPVVWGRKNEDSLFASHDEDSRDALFGKAQAYVIAKKYLEAAKEYRKIMELYPEDVLSYRAFLDIVHGTLGQPEVAEKEFRKAIQKVKDKQVLQKLFRVFHESTTDEEIELQ